MTTFVAEPPRDRRASAAPRGSERHGWRERRAKQDVARADPERSTMSEGSRSHKRSEGRRSGIYGEATRRRMPLPNQAANLRRGNEKARCFTPANFPQKV